MRTTEFGKSVKSDYSTIDHSFLIFTNKFLNSKENVKANNTMLSKMTPLDTLSNI